LVRRVAIKKAETGQKIIEFIDINTEIMDLIKKRVKGD